MAYQNVSVPRFYVDSPQFIRNRGLGFPVSSSSDIFNLNPASILGYRPANESVNYWGFGIFPPVVDNEYIGADTIPNINYGILNYVAILGHNLGTVMDDGEFDIGFRDNTDYTFEGDVYLDDLVPEGIINFESRSSIPYNGFSIVEFTDYGFRGINLYFSLFNTNAENKIGALSIGRYYDMKNAPNLSLTMSREYGSTKEFTTYNGSSMSNTMWNKPPSWGDLGAWELGNGNPALAKSGRRTWDLKFSFMDDGDLFGPNQTLTYYRINQEDESDEEDIAGGSNPIYFSQTLLTDDNFFSQVWSKTLGGTLPFIFQPDSNNNNPDQFAICRFKDSSLKATQSSFNVYDISLSIEEAW